MPEGMPGRAVCRASAGVPTAEYGEAWDASVPVRYTPVSTPGMNTATYHVCNLRILIRWSFQPIPLGDWSLPRRIVGWPCGVIPHMWHAPTCHRLAPGHAGRPQHPLIAQQHRNHEPLHHRFEIRRQSIERIVIAIERGRP